MRSYATKWMPLLLVATVGYGLSACDTCHNKSSGHLAPVASSLAPAKPPTKVSRSFEVEQKSSKADFLMAAPIEHIHGKAPASISGNLNIDLSDVTMSNGLIKVDLDKLTVYQSKRKDPKSKFSDEQKNAMQNEHMRTWLQISDKAPKAMQEANRYVEFKIEKVDSASEKNVLGMKGDERKVAMTVSGDLRLHGRVVKMTVKLEATFKFDGDKPVSVHVKTTAPVNVSLEAHDIKPRATIEKLAQKTLSALGQKVATEAHVTLEFDAKLAK